MGFENSRKLSPTEETICMKQKKKISEGAQEMSNTRSKAFIAKTRLFKYKVYRKIHLQILKNFRYKNSDIFHIS